MINLVCQWLITIFVVLLFYDYTEAGILALAMNITNFFFCVSTYNIRVFQTSDVKDEYNTGTYIAARIVTCTLSIVLCAFFLLLVGYSYSTGVVILFYMFFRATEAFVDVYHGISQKHWRMDYIGVSFAIRGVLSLVAFLALGRLYGLVVAVIGMAVVTALVGIFYDYPKTKTLSSLKPCFGKSVIVLLKHCFPLMLTILISTLIVSYSRYSVERVHGVEALGVFASVVSPTMIVQVFAAFIFTPLINVFADALEKMDIKKFIKIFGMCCFFIICFILAIYIGAYVLGEWGLVLLFDEPIRPYSYLFRGAVIASGFTAFMWFMNIIFSIIRDIRGIFYANIIGVVLCFAIIDRLLINYGLAGANYVMIISQGVAVAYLFIRLFWFMKTKMKIQ